MGEWRQIKWGDAATLEYGKGLSGYQIGGGKYAVYGTNGRIGSTNSFLCPFPSVIIGRKGAYRGVHYSPAPFWVIDTAFYLVPKSNDIDAKFAYYQLKTVDIDFMDSGSAIPSTSREDFYDLDLLLPPLDEQRAIASVLSSLDDKIDLLHRQNKTLEAMAETVWRQWFVEGVQRHDWEEKSLNQIADYLNGLACQNFPPHDMVNRLPVIKIKELRAGPTESSDWATSNVSPEYIINTGDVLFSWSGSLEVVVWGYGKGILNQHLFKVTSGKYPKWFYYLATKSFLPEFRDIADDKATTMGHIQRHHLSDTVLPVPPLTEFPKYNRIMEPIIEKLITNLRATAIVAQTRDTLLPKLMSGEVRVSS